MAYFEEGSEAMLALEQMVDKVGLRNTLYALAKIAREKADHIQTNWQDEELAAAWIDNARVVDRAANSIKRAL